MGKKFGVFIFSFDRIYGLTISLLIAQIGVNLAKYIETCFLYKKNPLNFKTILSMLIIIMVNGGIVLVFLFVKVNIVLWMIFGVMAGVACVLINFFVASLYRKTDFKTLLSLRV